MTHVERHLWGDSRSVGYLYTVTGMGLGTGAGIAMRHCARGSEIVATALAGYLAVASRSLNDSASAVERELVKGDLGEARRLLPALVGRDPAELDEKGIAQAVVESVAENTVDALVAPGLWALVGGPAGVLAHRAMNTMDAMVGYRSPRYARFGWASARLDDVMNWLPARLTVGLVMAARPSRISGVVGAVRRVRAERTPEHSPNALYAEAAFAGALGVRLGGRTVYEDRVESRPEMGVGHLPGVEDIGRAVELSRSVRRMLVGLLVASGGVGIAMSPGSGRAVDHVA